MRWLLVMAMACSNSAPVEDVPAARPGGKVELVEPPVSGDLASYVAGEVKRGQADRVPVLVYVGATWCEPCKELHAAAAAGKLDATIGPLRLIEFDSDRDGTWLEAAGYKSALVPLIAIPNAQGRASGKQLAGVRTGRSYIDQLTRGILDLLK